MSDVARRRSHVPSTSRRRRARPARPRRAPAEASRARARRSGSSSAAKRCSGAGSGCARSARCGRRPRRAVRGEYAVLVVAAEEGDLDLLALVLVRVVLHGRGQSSGRNGRPPGEPDGAQLSIDGHRRSRDRPPDAATRPAVGDDEHALAGVPLGDRAQRGDVRSPVPSLISPSSSSTVSPARLGPRVPVPRAASSTSRRPGSTATGRPRRAPTIWAVSRARARSLE